MSPRRSVLARFQKLETCRIAVRTGRNKPARIRRLRARAIQLSLTDLEDGQTRREWPVATSDVIAGPARDHWSEGDVFGYCIAVLPIRHFPFDQRRAPPLSFPTTSVTLPPRNPSPNGLPAAQSRLSDSAPRLPGRFVVAVCTRRVALTDAAPSGRAGRGDRSRRLLLPSNSHGKAACACCVWSARLRSTYSPRRCSLRAS